MTTAASERHDPPPPGTWAEPGPHDHRSPCPALNSLANGGFLPRDGRVTVEDLVRAIHGRLGVTRGVARMLAHDAMRRLGRPGPDGTLVLDLHDLALHGFIEHDASLSRVDAREGDAARLAPTLLRQLLSLSVDGRTLTLSDLATAHQLRVVQSRADGHMIPIKAAVLGTLEAALLYLVLGRDGGIALADAMDFFAHERIPEHLAPHPIGLGEILLAAFRLAVEGNLPFFEAARRARRIAEAPPLSETPRASHASHAAVPHDVAVAAAAAGCPFHQEALAGTPHGKS